jgi:predicted nucleotidyltransferase
LVDHVDVLEIRPTKDIDLSVEIATLSDFYVLEGKLRGRGFRNDTREGAPICRWTIDEVTVDVMPTDAGVLGMASEWFDEAVQRAQQKDLGDGIIAPIVSRSSFLATKLTAYQDRGAKDPILSKDLEDIATLFNGCGEPKTLLAGGTDAIKEFISQTLRTHLDDPEFCDAVMGNFRSDLVSRERARIVLERMRLIAGHAL